MSVWKARLRMCALAALVVCLCAHVAEGVSMNTVMGTRSRTRLSAAAQLQHSSTGSCTPGQGHSCCQALRCPYQNGVCCPGSSTCCPATGKCVQGGGSCRVALAPPTSTASQPCPCVQASQTQVTQGSQDGNEYVPTCQCARGSKPAVSAADAVKIRELKDAEDLVDKRIAAMKAMKHQLQRRLAHHASNIHNLPDVEDRLAATRRRVARQAEESKENLQAVITETTRRLKDLRQQALERRVKAIEKAKRKNPLKSVVLVLNDNSGHKDGARLPADGALMAALASTGVLPGHLAAAALLGGNSTDGGKGKGKAKGMAGKKRDTRGSARKGKGKTNNNSTSLVSDSDDPHRDPGHPSRAHRDADAHQDGIASYPALGSAKYLQDLHSYDPGAEQQKRYEEMVAGTKSWKSMKGDFSKVTDKAKQMDAKNKKRAQGQMRFQQATTTREQQLDAAQDQLEQQEIEHLERLAAFHPTHSKRRDWGDAVRDPRLKLARTERFREAAEAWKQRVQQSSPDHQEDERQVIINLIMPKHKKAAAKQGTAQISQTRRQFEPKQPPKTMAVCLLTTSTGGVRSLVQKDGACENPEAGFDVRTLWYAEHGPSKGREPFCVRTSTQSNATSAIVAGSTSCAATNWTQNFVFYSPTSYQEGTVPLCVRASQTPLHAPVIITDLYATQCGSGTEVPLWKQVLQLFVFPGQPKK